MKTIKMNAVVAGLLSAGALLMTPMTSFAAEAGQGWDAFNTGDGERIVVNSASAYMGTSQSSAVGQSWDTFNTGDGERFPEPNYKRASPASAASEGVVMSGHVIYGD